MEVCHTHISVVFLAGAYAYKVKKPVNLGFLDFSTLGQRRLKFGFGLPDAGLQSLVLVVICQPLLDLDVEKIFGADW